MSKYLIRSNLFLRLLDSTIPLLTWGIISLPLWFSPFHPALVAYFIIGFDLFFFYKSIHTALYATLSYNKIKEMENIDFVKKVLPLLKKNTISHFVIIPNYHEPLYKLEATIDAIVANDYPDKNKYLVLAFEKIEVDAKTKAERLISKYKAFFQDVLVSYHKLNYGEIQGKASNQTHAARIVEKYVEGKKLSSQNVIISICDADSLLPKNYFSYLTYAYLTDPERQYHFYWAPVLLYNNFWQLPIFVRMQATLSSIVRLALLSYKDNLIQISTYATSLTLLQRIGFWDVDIIPEDWHIYLQAFFKYGEKVKTVPLFTIINGDAVYSGKLFKTLANRYEQEKRWAWGVSDIGFALRKFFVTPHINPIVKLRKILYLVETHLLWPTSFFILTVSASIPPLVNPIFKRTVLGFLLPQLSGLILTFSSLLLILYVYLDIKLRQKVNSHTKPSSIAILIIQWYLLPVVSFLFSSLPALESHTRLLLGKKIKYKVTEKV